MRRGISTPVLPPDPAWAEAKQPPKPIQASSPLTIRQVFPPPPPALPAEGAPGPRPAALPLLVHPHGRPRADPMRMYLLHPLVVAVAQAIRREGTSDREERSRAREVTQGRGGAREGPGVKRPLFGDAFGARFRRRKSRSYQFAFKRTRASRVSDSIRASLLGE